jgi:hypothetical protein
MMFARSTVEEEVHGISSWIGKFLFFVFVRVTYHADYDQCAALYVDLGQVQVLTSTAQILKATILLNLRIKFERTSISLKAQFSVKCCFCCPAVNSSFPHDTYLYARARVCVCFMCVEGDWFLFLLNGSNSVACKCSYQGQPILLRSLQSQHKF